MIRRLQELSGASPAMLGKAVQIELASGSISDQGADPDHRDPGSSAPTLYKRS